MTDQPSETVRHAQDLFLIIALFVQNLATTKEVELLAQWVAPLNDAICARIGPLPGKKTN